MVPTILRPQCSIMAIGRARKIAKYVEDPNAKEGYRFEPADTVSLTKIVIILFLDQY